MIDKKDITILSLFSGKNKGKDYEACARRFVDSFRRNVSKNIPIILWVNENNLPKISTINFVESYNNVELVYGINSEPEPTKDGSWICKVDAIYDCDIHTKYCWYLDIDMYFYRDPFNLIYFDFDLMAPPMNYSHNFGASSKFTNMWEQYYNYFGLEWDGKRKLKTNVDKKLGNFYFNSSSMIYRTDINFDEKYKNHAIKLLKSGLPHCTKRFSQTCLPIIVDKYKLKYKPMGRLLHYMYHLNNYTLENDDGEPSIIHYCDNRIKEILDEHWEV